MRIVTSAHIRKAFGLEIMPRPHIFYNHIINACILFPVRGTNPNIGKVADFSKNMLHIHIPFIFNIPDKQLIGTQNQ